LFFGWHSTLAYHIKALIRKVLMVGARRAPLSFKRTIDFNREGILIEDELTLKNHLRVKDIYVGDEIPVRYVPQSRYFQGFELETKGEYLSIQDIARLNYDRKISVFRKVNFSEQK